MRIVTFPTIIAVAISSAATTTSAHYSTFTALTDPLPLFPGEVTNTFHRLKIPPGPIAISEFAADVVEKHPITGELVPVPLSEAYLHHHVVQSESKFYHPDNDKSGAKKKKRKRSVGFGAGTESRGTPQRFPAPYRFTTIEGEDELVANVHVINTRSMSPNQARRCLECPCTAEDHVQVEDEEDGRNKTVTALAASIVERERGWDTCNSALLEEENTSCFPDTYRGGLFCCEHGEFCSDDYFFMSKNNNNNGTTKRSVFYLRYSLTYTPVDVTPDEEVRPLYLAACCDASGDESKSGAIEYDIPNCHDDDDVCIHELETVQTLHGAALDAFGTGGPADENEDGGESSDYVDVVYVVGHLHRGGISMESYFMNGTTLCVSLPTYGSGEPGEIGNEPGYINSMSSCTFDPPLRMKKTDEIRVVGRYNASEAHTGVMSLFYVAISDVVVDDDEPAVRGEGGGVSLELVSARASPPIISSATTTTSLEQVHSFAVFVMVGAVIGATWYLVAKAYRRRNYESIPTESGHDLSV